MRGVPVQYCPYCGDQDLRPREDHPDEGLSNAWECADCRAVFVVSRATRTEQTAQAPEPARGRT